MDHVLVVDDDVETAKVLGLPPYGAIAEIEGESATAFVANCGAIVGDAAVPEVHLITPLLPAFAMVALKPAEDHNRCLGSKGMDDTLARGEGCGLEQLAKGEAWKRQRRAARRRNIWPC